MNHPCRYFVFFLKYWKWTYISESVWPPEHESYVYFCLWRSTTGIEAILFFSKVVKIDPKSVFIGCLMTEYVLFAFATCVFFISVQCVRCKKRHILCSDLKKIYFMTVRSLHIYKIIAYLQCVCSSQLYDYLCLFIFYLLPLCGYYGSNWNYLLTNHASKYIINPCFRRKCPVPDFKASPPSF